MKVSIQGSIAAQVDQAVLEVAGALRRGVTTAGKRTQSHLRDEARNAGFRDGGRAIANAWRLQVYPTEGKGERSWRPAALVFSKMPEVVTAFDQGAVIVAAKRKFLAIPTPINAPNRRSRMRVTPQEMLRLGGFVRPTRNPRVQLWCLRLRTETTKRGRLRLFAGRYSEILTGHTRGQQQQRLDYADSHSFVPMFFLMRQVTLRKRLDIAAIEQQAQMDLAAAVGTELSRLGGPT